jgi:hypothetical protein
MDSKKWAPMQKESAQTEILPTTGSQNEDIESADASASSSRMRRTARCRSGMPCWKRIAKLLASRATQCVEQNMPRLGHLRCCGALAPSTTVCLRAKQALDAWNRSGMIGSYIGRELLTRGCHVHGIVRFR